MTHIGIGEIASFHAALGEPARVRLVRLLLERELCVCELTRALCLPQYSVSRHLGVLKRAGLVRDWREGTWVHYEISPSLPSAMRKSLVCLKSVWDRSPRIQEDLQAIRSSGRRPGAPVAACTI